MAVKGRIFVALALAVLVTAGCKQKTEPAQPAAAPSQGMPADAMHGANPHAGLAPADIPAGAGHAGTVVEVLQTGQFTYVQVDEKGKKVWVAVPKVDVKKGDKVEFPNAPALLNYQSKSLNRTFDSVIFVQGLRISK
ncbi:MAG TPA: hypothetical protein VFR01_06530 [Geobacterales bacterium]|jgi:hypothetical protein|nr:hypothetical protein [Geobacterales bacterium]